MALKSQKLKDLVELNRLLRGGVAAGNVGNTFFNINGKTLILSAPSALTCTFSAAGAQVPTTLAEVITQINDSAIGLAGIVASVYQGGIALIEATPAGGVAIDPTGTATAMLGFSNNTGVVYAAPGGTAPALVSVSPTVDNMYLVITDEA